MSRLRVNRATVCRDFPASSCWTSSNPAMTAWSGPRPVRGDAPGLSLLRGRRDLGRQAGDLSRKLARFEHHDVRSHAEHFQSRVGNRLLDREHNLSPAFLGPVDAALSRRWVEFAPEDQLQPVQAGLGDEQAGATSICRFPERS
jgi:hypothetical protein